MSKATWRKELFNRLASSPKPRTQVPYVGRVSPKSNTRKSPKPYGRRSQREIIAKGSIELIRIVAFSIISSLNNLGIHLSDHYIIYIVSISKLVYLYIMYCVKYTVNYSKTEISIIIKEFIETVSNLLELPRKNLQNNSQDIQRCVTNVATENIISKFGSYIGYSGGENIETKQLSNLKTQLESTNVKISSELYKLKNDFVKEILTLKSAFSIIDEMFIKEMENAEIRKKYWLRNYFIGLFGSSFLLDTFLNIKDPKELNEFIISIMNPYKEDDMYVKFNKEIKLLKEKEENTEKRYRELKNIKENIDKLSIQNYKLTNDLLNQNINLSKNIYEKIEEGNNGFNLNIPKKKTNLSKIINLFNSESSKNLDDNNIELYKNEISYVRKNSDSDFSDMDIHVDTKV